MRRRDAWRRADDRTAEGCILYMYIALCSAVHAHGVLVCAAARYQSVIVSRNASAR
jgi:hypothetical protein